MSKIRPLLLAISFAIALLAVLGLAANISAQPQQPTDLAERVAALETALVDQASLIQDLTTRVSDLETELGLATQEVITQELTTQELTTSTLISTADWVTVTSATKRFTYPRTSEWDVITDKVDGLVLNLQNEEFIFFSIDNSIELLMELQADEVALRNFAEESAPEAVNVEDIEVLLLDSQIFNEMQAVLAEVTFLDQTGDMIRQHLAYYQCQEDNACLIVLTQFESDSASSLEGWAFLKTFANRTSFLAVPVVNTTTYLRECPSTECDSREMIQKGQGIEIVAQSSDGKWYQIDSGEWLPANIVRDAPSELPVVSSGPATTPMTSTAPITAAAPITNAEASSLIVKVATQSPLTGPQSLFGIAIKNGAELALEQLGGDLEAMGVTVELVPFDDQANAEIGLANANQIVADPAILCMIGHLNSSTLLPSMETYHNAQLAVVSPANTYPEVTDTGYAEINRIVGRDDVQGVAAQRFAAESLGVKSVYILHDNTVYGQPIAELFRQAAIENEMEILGFVGTVEQENFSTLIAPILAANPDLVYFAGIYWQTGAFFGQARDAGVTALFMAPDGTDSPEIATLAGEGIVGLHYTAMAAPPRAYPDAEEFVVDYDEQFGESPEPFAAQGYDAMGICLEGIAGAIKTNGEIMPTHAEVATAVRDTTDYPGITGSITFNEKGDRINAPYFVIEVLSSDPNLWGENEIVATIEAG